MEVMTRQTVDSLLAETGHQLTPDDIDGIVALDKCAVRIRKGEDDKELRLFDFPYYADGVAFHVPTIGKDVFWRERIVDCVPEEWRTVAFLWLLSQESLPDGLTTRVMIRKIKRFGRKCMVSLPNVKKVLDRFTADDGEGSEQSEYGAILSLLVREYGQTCQHWLSAPIHEIQLHLADWTKRQEAQAAAMRKASAKSKQPTPPAATPKIKALAGFATLREEMRAKWQKSA